MSDSLSILDKGAHVVINQTARETLTIQSDAHPIMMISPDGGASLTLQQTTHTLTLSQSGLETLVIHEPSGDVVIISEAGEGGEISPYGPPHTLADDGEFYFYAWQHVDGTRWKAQRLELATLDLRAVTGPNPQPVSLTDFQNVSF